MSSKPSPKSISPHARTLPAQQLVALLRQPPPRQEVSHAYDQLRQKYILEQAIKHFSITPEEPAPLFGKTLLDVGSGESTIAEFLALSGADITAIDPNPAALRKAEESAKAFGAPITFMNVKAEDLISGNRKFDVVLALDVAEDVPDLSRLLWALKQLVKPGGLIVFSAIARTPQAWLMHIFMSETIYQRTPKGRRSVHRFYSPGKVRALATAQGLKTSDVQHMRFSYKSRRWKFSHTGTRYLTTFTL